MKTTLDLDDALLRRAKQAALDASIARERADPGDDPVRLARRLGPGTPKVGRR